MEHTLYASIKIQEPIRVLCNSNVNLPAVYLSAVIFLLMVVNASIISVREHIKNLRDKFGVSDNGRGIFEGLDLLCPVDKSIDSL